MKKILYFYPINTSFVASDLRLISKAYDVCPYLFRASKKILTPFFFIHQFFYILFRIFSIGNMVSHFSGYHTFLPSLLGRLFHLPHYIILHGTECNNFPEYRYGFLIRPLLFWFSKKSMVMASRLLPVSESLVEQDYTYRDTTYKKQGLHAFYPGIRTPVTVIYNGVSPDHFKILSSARRVPNSFITVAAGLEDSSRRKLKGLDFICTLAGRFPDLSFTFIGGGNKTSLIIPPNIRLIGHVSNEHLGDIYNQHQFYLQLSDSEGFGISVVEAMMCGCIPIVSHVGILPKIVGSFGHVLKHKDIDLLDVLVRYAMDTAESVNLNTLRQWAVDHFALELREKALLNILATK